MPFIKFSEFTLENALLWLVSVLLCLCEKEFCNLQIVCILRPFQKEKFVVVVVV